MNGFHVLVVDDSETALGMLSYVLSSAGFSVETAADGIEALKAASRRVPDLVLLDVRMPRMGGIQSCRLLKSDAATRDVPVILLTSQESGSERIHAVRAGADGLLLKGCPPQDVVSASRELLAGRLPRRAPGNPAGGPDAPDDLEILIRVNQVLEAGLFEATLFNEIGTVGRVVEDFEATVRGIDRILSEIVPHDALAAVFSDGISLESVIVYGFSPGDEVRRATRDAMERLRSDSGVPAATGGAGLVEFHCDGRRPEGEPAAERFRPWIHCPIRSGDMVKGLLALFSDNGSPLVAEERLAESLLRHAFAEMENAWLYREISRISATDALTGLTNRRQFVECLKREHARASRHRVPYSLLLVDIDHFKRVNDVYGHPVGDVVLREFAAVLRAQCRESDHPARYGGEEFVILLPGTGGNEGMTAAERIRMAIERSVFAAPSPLVRATVSIGVSAFDPDAPRGDRDMLASADAALYAAKREGRNRVCAR